MSTAVSALINSHLRRQHMTAADVQRKVGLSKAFVGKWIKQPRGDRPVSPDTLRRMARAIDADLVELTIAELESCGYTVRKPSERGWPGSVSWNELGREFTQEERDRIAEFVKPLFGR